MAKMWQKKRSPVPAQEVLCVPQGRPAARLKSYHCSCGRDRMTTCPPSVRARAAWRRGRALELAAEGRPWDDIAREVGYSTRGAAHNSVMRALHARTIEAVDDHRQLEVARLDAFQAALWDRAVAGDVDAAEAVTKIVLARCRILGLLPHPSAVKRRFAKQGVEVGAPPAEATAGGAIIPNCPPEAAPPFVDGMSM